jgi:hypothetical protein
VPKLDVEVAQVGFGDIQKGFPGIKPFVGKDFAVLGQTQSHQAFAQAAHVGEWGGRERGRERPRRRSWMSYECVGGSGRSRGRVREVVEVVSIGKAPRSGAVQTLATQAW